MKNRIPINLANGDNNGRRPKKRDADELPEIIAELLPDADAPEIEVELVGDEHENQIGETYFINDSTNGSSAPAKNKTASDAQESADASPKTDKELRGAYEKLRTEIFATRAELRRVETELEKSNEAAKAATDEKHAAVEHLARLQADFENFRKRIERERGETYNRLVGDVVAHLLPVLDNLRRALKVEASIEAGESEEFRHFLHGVELIGKQLGGVLESLGIEPVATIGQLFDPHIHEAVAIESSDEFEPDTVIQELVSGYRLGDKLLRPASVKVATRPE